MDSCNSGSISSSGDEEYDDSPAHLPSTFLNPTHFGSISNPQSSLVSSLFDLSSQSYLHPLSQSQPQRSEPNCTQPTSLPSSSLLGPQVLTHQPNARPLSTPPTNNNNNVRNSKKRTRASRRAPTTVLTTDTTNFRSMVQEFTGIPAPPFSPSSSSSYSRRFDLLPADFYPLRPSPQKVQVQPNPLFFPSRLFHNNMVDAIASSTTNNSACASSSINTINYQLPSPDLGLPYHHPQSNNTMLSMQNHPPILAFHTPPPLVNTVPAGFGEKSQASVSIPLLEDLQGMSHGTPLNAHLIAHTGVPVPPGHEQVVFEGMPRRSVRDDGCEDRRDPFRCLDGRYGKVGSGDGSCNKLNFPASASSSLNHEKTLENSSTRGEGTVDSWICSNSD